MPNRLMLAVAALALTGAAWPWQQKALASAAPFIDRANHEWTVAMRSRNADVLAAPYDEHGIFIGPDGSVSVGKAAVRAMYAGRPASVQVIKAEIHSDGRAAHDPDDVYEWGTAKMSVQRGGAVKQASGRYLTVWHRTGSRWVITRNIAF